LTPIRPGRRRVRLPFFVKSPLALFDMRQKRFRNYKKIVNLNKIHACGIDYIYFK